MGVENGNEERRRHGRPSQAKESQIPGASKVGNPGYQFHVVPAVPFLQPHVGPQPGNKQMDGTNPNVLPMGGQFGVQMNPQQYMGNQAAMRPSVVYMFPGGYDPQTLGNGSVMPWVYQHMYQAGQQLKELPGAVAGQPGRKRKASCHRKIGQSAANPNEPPGPAPSGLTPTGPAPLGLTPTGPASSGGTPPGPTSSPPSTAPPGPTPMGQTAG